MISRRQFKSYRNRDREPAFGLALYYFFNYAKPTCGALLGQREASHGKTAAAAEHRSR